MNKNDIALLDSKVNEWLEKAISETEKRKKELEKLQANLDMRRKEIEEEQRLLEEKKNEISSKSEVEESNEENPLQEIAETYGDMVEQSYDQIEKDLESLEKDLQGDLKMQQVAYAVQKFTQKKFSKRRFSYFLDKKVLPQGTPTQKANQLMYSKKHAYLFIIADEILDTMRISNLKEFTSQLKSQDDDFEAYIESMLWMYKFYQLNMDKMIELSVSTNKKYLDVILEIHEEDKTSKKEYNKNIRENVALYISVLTNGMIFNQLCERQFKKAGDETEEDD